MRSLSVRTTQRYAAQLAAQILKTGPRRSGATIIALHGDLGAGKTTFTQGLLRALGVNGRVTSPTFLIVRRYALKSQKSKVKGQRFRNAYHFDLYRIHAASELRTLEFDTIIADPENIVIIEWPERLGRKRHTYAVRLRHGSHEKERILEI